MHRLHQGHDFLPLRPLTQEEISSLPDRPAIDERVFVIGSGIAGCTAAWVLSEAGYAVTILEQLDMPFSSTSIGALGIHLGGRYPKDWKTAVECLHSGILMKKLMGFAFSDSKLRFLMADDSPMSFDRYLKHYRKLQQYYSQLPAEDHVFGPPEEFFRILEPEELKAFHGISGGIETQEACFDMDRVRTVLLRTLKARGVTLLTSTEVLGVSKNDGEGARYGIRVRNLKTGVVEVLHAETVVNAAGPQTRTIGQTLRHMPKRRLDLRFFQDVELNSKAQASYPFPFVVMPVHMHYVPLGGGTASLVGFSHTLGSIQVEEGQRWSIPVSWRQQLKARSVHGSAKRASIAVAMAREKFMPELGDAKVRTVYPGVAVCFNFEPHMKRQQRVERTPGMPNYFTINPTKASHSIGLALELADRLVKSSVQSGRVTTTSGYLADVVTGRSLAHLATESQSPALKSR